MHLLNASCVEELEKHGHGLRVELLGLHPGPRTLLHIIQQHCPTNQSCISVQVSIMNPVLAKRSLIKDLVLLRTKLLKWSFFGPFFYTKVLFFPIKIIMLCNPVPGTKEAAC